MRYRPPAWGWAIGPAVAGLLMASGCESDPVDGAAPLSRCDDGLRRVIFRLDTGADVVRCVEIDTALASSSPDCTVMVWTAPANRRHDEGLRYEVSALDSTTPCGSEFFFAVVQNSAGGYTYFDGQVRRGFDTGSGPFATGVYEVINYQQTLVGIGHFEFWE
ncbi:MAG: hypothetical protein OEV86_06485 [Candidatus Krumholzibacteria bacterium]|nr:hypothetical protein [Candidatus Krumholzibacteria bacterium]